MKLFSAWGKTAVVLLLLNEIRGVLMVASVLGAWSHAGRAAAPPPAPACAWAPQFARTVVCRLTMGVERLRTAAAAPAQPSGNNGATINPQ